MTDSPAAEARSASRESRSSWYAPLIALPIFAVTAAMANWVIGLRLPLPKCGLRALTGIPCPSCGCTRSLAAWVHLDLEQAFRFNPLFFCGCVILLGWLAMTVAERCLQRRLLPEIRLSLRRWPLWKIGLGLAAVNWLYLCLTLPK